MKTCMTCGLRRIDEAVAGSRCKRCDKIAFDAVVETAEELALQAGPGATGWSG